MREEEKMARDVYLEMFEKWGAAIFSNIAVCGAAAHGYDEEDAG